MRVRRIRLGDAPPRARRGWRALYATGSSLSPLPLDGPPVSLPPLSEGLLGNGLEVADRGPTREPAREASYGAPAGEGPLADPRKPLGPLVEFRVGEDLGESLHRYVLGVELRGWAAHVLLFADHFATQVDEDLRDVDLDRTNLVAGTAERGGVGQRVGARVADPDELGRQDRAYGARVDGVVGVAAGPFVDGADVEARRTTDAVQGLPSYLVGQHVGTPVVQEDQVELLRPITFRDPGPERSVRVHPLRRRGAGE